MERVYRGDPGWNVALYNGVTHNNLYMGSLIAPIPLILVGLMVNFSLAALATALGVAGLLAFRYFVIRRTACPHCAAKGRCPNAKAMGIG